MSREHGEVRLHRGDFSGQWFAVRLASDGRTILDKWPIHPGDAAMLELRDGGAALTPGELADLSATIREYLTTESDVSMPSFHATAIASLFAARLAEGVA